MKRTIVGILAAAALGTAMLATTALADLSAATDVPLEDLPVSGIGCMITSDVKANEEYKIGYIAKNTTNPYMVAQGEGVAKAGEDMGFEAIVQAPTTADSVEEQVKLMEDMITQGCNAIIVHCADSNGIMELGSVVRKILRDGIEIQATNDGQVDLAEHFATRNAFNELQAAFNTLVGSSSAQEAIDTFNEIVAFLDGYSAEDNTLAGLINTLTNSIDDATVGLTNAEIDAAIAAAESN